MKKGILCILLSILMLVPMFTSCSSELVIEDVEAKVYTLYTIKDEETTPEAIRQVELALNRILFHRLGVILKLVMVNEDEYEQLIEDKYAEVEAYRLAKKNNTEEEEVDESSEGSEEAIEGVITGDDILSMLEHGGQIPLEEPRLDIFLVRGYDKYYELATNGKLVALDEKLNNEGKSLRSSIHSTLFTAAKVGNKTYGVPVNNAIGEYTYLVFDAELLAQHNVDPNTLTTLEDLRDYLDVVHKNNPDVIPLKNVEESISFNFLTNPGFPALVQYTDLGTRRVVNAYQDSQFKDYYSMIARYRALGYLADDFTATASEEGANYAVRFESGTIDSITKKLQKEYGKDRKFAFTEFSPPIATNENTIDNIFCVSEFVSSADELTDVIEVLEAINTDAQLMNILTYGVENAHYKLDEDGFVVRLSNDVLVKDPENPDKEIPVKNTYIVDPNHVGNCFITYILKDTEHDTTNANLWIDAIKQNQDAIVSPSLGFTSNPKKFSYVESVEVEDLENPGQTIMKDVTVDIYEPDYIAVINEVVSKYYPALLSGTAVEFNYEEIFAKAEAEISQTFVDKLDEQFEENVLKPMFAEMMREEVTKNQGDEILKEAEEYVREDLYDDVKKKLKNKLTSKLKGENPEATSSEINDMVKELLTDEYIKENFATYYTEEEVLEQIEIEYNSELESAIEDAIDEIEDTDEYADAFDELRASDDYQNQLNMMLSYDAPNKILALVDTYIADEIAVFTDSIVADIEVAIGEVVTTFVTENAEKLGMTEDELYVEIGYKQEETVNAEGEEGEAAPAAEAETETEESVTEGEGEGEGEEAPEKTYVTKYETWFDFAFQEKIVDPYYTMFGDPDKVAA